MPPCARPTSCLARPTSSLEFGHEPTPLLLGRPGRRRRRPAACSPTVTTHGHAISPSDLAAIQPGVTSREEVTRRLGSPSTIGTFDTERWFYVSQRNEVLSFYQADVTAQDVVQIDFDGSGIVTDVRTHGLAICLLVRVPYCSGHDRQRYGLSQPRLPRPPAPRPGCAITAPDPIPRAPMAKTNASSRPACANGPMPAPPGPPPRGPTPCTPGSTDYNHRRPHSALGGPPACPYG